MSDPWIAIFVGISVLAYIAAIIWTGRDKVEFVPATPVRTPESLSPIDFSYGVYADSSCVADEDGKILDNIHAITFCLAVTNTSASGATLRRLQASTRVTLSDFVVCPIRESSSDTIDLRHGEIATIEVGNVFVSDAEMKVMARGGLRRVVTKHPESVAHNVCHGHRSLYLSDYAGLAQIGVGGGAKPETPWIQPISISADDTVGCVVPLEVDLHGDRQWEWVRLKKDDQQSN